MGGPSDMASASVLMCNEGAEGASAPSLHTRTPSLDLLGLSVPLVIFHEVAQSGPAFCVWSPVLSGETKAADRRTCP